jgi:cytochrome c553
MIGLRTYVIGAALGALALAALPLTGLPPHAAGHDASAFGWYRWMAQRQSVTLRSITLVPPSDLTDPARAARSAGHYEMACAPCHGSPAGAPDLFARDMRPAPPPLAGARAWRPPARVFQTVQHGLAGSGMPAWPTQARPDEVWDMVAFLQRLPDLDPEDYRRQAGRSGDCAHCHGAKGEGRDGIPRLDILSPAYIAASLRAFRDGSRASGTMIAVASSLSDEAIDQAAIHYGAPVLPPAPIDDGSAAAAIAYKGLPERDVPACLSCHGTNSRPDHPRLAGQDPRYLLRQLDLFARLGSARGGSRAALMAEAVRETTPEQRRALAAWFGRRP